MGFFLSLKRAYRAVLVIFFLSACGVSTIEKQPTSTLDSTSRYSGGSLEGGSVSEVSFDSENQASIDFEEPSEDTKYVLMLYTYNESGKTDAYQLGNSASLSSPGRILQSTLASDDEDITEDFHQNLRELEEELDDSAALMTETNIKAAKKTAEPDLGSTKAFKVLSSFSGSGSYETVKAVLAYKTDNFLAWVDSRNLNSIPAEDMSSLLEDFDDLIPAERKLFGVESDVDDDGRFNILFTQVVNELGGSSGGIVTGFFYAVDLFEESTYAQSNETEVFYTFVPDPDGKVGAPISLSFALSNILKSVLPHEYQHMINFNMHYFTNKGSPEKSFLNEGLSHLAEDLYNNMQYAANEHPARIAGYLASIDNLCIVCGASLYQRGGSYLLLRYLYEQADLGNLTGATSGSALIGRMMNTTLTGVDNIVSAAYGNVEVESSFRNLMGQFGLAIFLSNTGLSTDSRHQFSGINLRAAQSDNRGTTLQGPAINSMSNYSLNDTIGGASISYVNITSEDIEAMGGNAVVRFSDDADVGAYLIQTGI